MTGLWRALVWLLAGRLAAGVGPKLGFRLHLFAPSGGRGRLPVIFFVSGFAGDAPIFTYSDLLAQLAGRGFIVLGADRLGMPNYPHEARDFLQVLQWARGGGLQEMLTEQGLNISPDLEKRAAVMAHSAGNHVVGQALAYDCSVARAWVLLDPVDGFDPYGIVKSQDLITPGEKLNFSLPALILNTGLDPKPSNPLFPACAPQELSTPRFYAALPGPVWDVNATVYGHLDCLNLLWTGHRFCPSDPASDKAAYHSHVTNTTARFLQALFEKQQAQLQFLADQRSFNVTVTLQHDLKGLKLEDVQPSCSNDGSPLII